MPKYKEERIRLFSKKKTLKRRSNKQLKDLLLAREKDYDYYKHRMEEEAINPGWMGRLWPKHYREMLDSATDKVLEIRAEIDARRNDAS